jgi:hypothetical protein
MIRNLALQFGKARLLYNVSIKTAFLVGKAVFKKLVCIILAFIKTAFKNI